MRRKAFCLLVVVVSALCATTAHAQRWQDADLTALTGGPDADYYSKMAMAFDPAYNGMRTHYVANGQIHELFLGANGRWQDANLTALTGGPPTGGPLAMVFDPVYNGMRTHYVANNEIHELFLDANGRWQNANLTAMTGALRTDGPWGLGMAFDPVWQVMRTHYVVRDRHVHELYLSGGRWQDADLSAIAGGPAARASHVGIVTVFDPFSNGMRTHYTAEDSRVHELFLGANGRWQDADLTIPGVPLGSSNLRPSTMAFNPFTNETQAFYLSDFPHNHVFELFLAGGAWGFADLTAGTGGPPKIRYNAWGQLRAAFDPQWNAMRTHYVADDWHVHELFYAGGFWRHADLTAITGGALTSGGPLAMAWDPIYSGMRTHYRGADGHIHELFLPGHAS